MEEKNFALRATEMPSEILQYFCYCFALSVANFTLQSFVIGEEFAISRRLSS